MPNACIGADVIVGFPGENENEFIKTYNFIKSLDLSYLHVFTYSERDNTDAINYDGIVPKQIRSKRSKLLRLLSSRKKLEFYQTHVGSYHNILFESENKNGYIEGLSENYIRYRRKWDSNLSGSIVKSKIVSIDQDGYAI